MAAWCTGGSGTVVSALATGSMACSAAPAPLPMITRPAYTGPEPACGVITTANGVPRGAPRIARSVTTTLLPAGTVHVLGLPGG